MEILPGDRALLEAYRRGEGEALERLYRAHVSDVAGFLRQGFTFSSRGRSLRFTGYHQPCDLQDALQETFMAAFGESARRGYDGLHPFRAYLLGIARNVVLGRFRRDVERLRCFQEVASEAPRDAAALPPVLARTAEPTPEEAAEAGEVRRVVEDFVRGLTEEQRLVVRLYFMEGRSQEATAGELRIDRNRVRKQITAIRKKLWRRLRREGLDHALPFRLLEVKP